MRKLLPSAALLGLFVFFAPGVACAQSTPSFTNLVESQVKDITTDFASNFMHTTASPPGSPSRFGLELGAIAGATRVHRISGIANGNLSVLPHAGILLIGHTPWFVLEGTALPAISRSGLTLENYSGGLRRPFIGGDDRSVVTFAARVHYTITRVGYLQTVLGAPINVNLNSRTFGGDLLLEYRLLFTEFFVGLGAARSNSTLGYSGATSIFNVGQIPSYSASSSYFGPTGLAGVQLTLPLITLSGEYSNVYFNHRVTGKLALRIPPF